MTIHSPLTMTKESFLAWIDRREERYEFAGGRVIMMVRVTWNHAVTTSNLVVAFKTRLDGEKYGVVSEAFAVDVGSGVRFPDVLVQPLPGNGKALEATAPILIAEVLSAGTLHTDFGDKRREYLALPTLNIYVVASADEPRVWVWQRVDGVFPPEPEIMEGADKMLSLASLGIEIPLAEIYRSVR